MRSEQGLTLIEVMIASALLAAALVVLGQLLTTAVISNVSAGKATMAIILASQKAEELRSSPLRPVGGADQIDQWGVVVGTGVLPAAGAVFARRWTIDVVPGSPLSTHIVHVHVETPQRPVTSVVAAARWP